MPLSSYIDWFRTAAGLVFSRCPKGSLAIFQQTDLVSGGRWVDKAGLLLEASQTCGAVLLWHKIVLDPEVLNAKQRGTMTGFSHILCFVAASDAEQTWDATTDAGRAIASSLACDLPDVLLLGRKVYARGMGIDAMAA